MANVRVCCCLGLVGSFIGQFYSDHDLQEFFGLFFNSSRGQVPKQIGNNDPSNVGMEASLDVQYLMRFVVPAPHLTPCLAVQSVLCSRARHHVSRIARRAASVPTSRRRCGTRPARTRRS